MKPSGKSLFALLIVGFLLGAVGQAHSSPRAGQPTVPTVEQLLGSDFHSIKAKGNRLIGNKAVQMRFFMHSDRPDSEPRRPTVGFSAGCNSWGGKFRVRNGRLILFGQVTGTAMACSKNPDRWFIKRFRKGFIVRATGDRLILSRPAERVRIILRKTS